MIAQRDVYFILADHIFRKAIYRNGAILFEIKFKSRCEETVVQQSLDWALNKTYKCCFATGEVGSAVTDECGFVSENDLKLVSSAAISTAESEMVIIAGNWNRSFKLLPIAKKFFFVEN